MKKRRARTQRRQAERALDKLSAAKERLLQLEPGGAPERPIEIASPAVVEVHAEAVPCPRCSGQQGVEEHAAVTVDGVRLREARLRCRRCGSARSLWFRVVASLSN